MSKNEKIELFNWINAHTPHKHGYYKKSKRLVRILRAELDKGSYHMTRNWKKMHPYVYKSNWKS